jgi:hypothetical protein
LKIQHKYRAVKTEVDGITFDSKREARRYEELKLLVKANEIRGLELQPEYEVKVEGKKICVYRADFRYWDEREGRMIVEDVKGVKTPVYRLKKKLVEAIYRVQIKET